MTDAECGGGAEAKIAVVTGGARGIGLAVSRRLHRDGWQVAILDRDLDEAERAAASLGATAHYVDVGRSKSVSEAFAAVREELGAITGLVCNAGISGIAAPITDQTDGEWDDVISIDLSGVFYCCREAVPGMVGHGWGRIVNVASIAGKEGNPRMAAYSAAKAGVLGLTKSLGKELATTGVTVNAVTPAVVQTQMLGGLTDDQVRYMVTRIPMGRTAEPDEVAAAVSFLLSAEASFTTGAVLDVSGGRATY